jgi:DNA-binding XRE family transcriptional regulator
MICRLSELFSEVFSLILSEIRQFKNKTVKQIKDDMLFREKIRQSREEKQLLQRQLGAALEIDTPMYSKIECGDRR